MPPSAKPGQPASLSPFSARRAALELLDAVLGRRHPLDEAVERQPAFAASGLSVRDRGFARLLAATVLRRLGQIDASLAACFARPLTPKARMIQNLLRLGAAQLLFLGTPPHAAVAETVALASGHLAPYRALANAVLRRLSRDGASLVAGQDAARLNLPDWLWSSWRAAYGEKAARACAEVILRDPPIDLSVKQDAEGWARRLGADLLPTGSLRLFDAGPVSELPGYREGAWWVQDAAAALPARLLGDVRDRIVVDLCAAPGGKTAELAAAGARVIAVDRGHRRIARLAANLARLGLTAETVIADAADWRPAAPVSHVLLDAPCSATGTIRRHPDILHLKTPDDVARLVPLQDRLLAAALGMLAPGGVLVYCVCSLEAAEGPQRIQRLLAGGAALERRPIAPHEIGGLGELVTPEGDLRTLPSHLAERGGLDGFYAARLVRAD